MTADKDFTTDPHALIDLTTSSEALVSELTRIKQAFVDADWSEAAAEQLVVAMLMKAGT